MAYEDLNTQFTGDLTTGNIEAYPVLNGIYSVKQGLQRLLSTPKGSNPFNRNYGSSVYDLLFENMASISTVQMLLYMDITNWEPRISINPGDINIRTIDANTYEISCDFIMKQYDIPATIKTTLTKE